MSSPSPTASTPQYDSIGTNYSNIKTLPLGPLEQNSIKSHLGPISSLSVLDLGCGTGFYSQKLLEWGASSVLGIDISPTMVDAARAANHVSDDNNNEKKSVDFVVADCSAPFETLNPNPLIPSSLESGNSNPKYRTLNITLAIWLLHYAPTPAIQTQTWRNIYYSLVPGGRTLGIVPNWDILPSPPTTSTASSSPSPSIPPPPSQSRYETSWEFLSPVEGGWKQRITVSANPPLVFECYTYERRIYERCALEAGMVGLRWLDAVDPQDPELDFAEFVRMPQFRIFEAFRPEE